MVHISCWFVLMILIHWGGSVLTVKENTQTLLFSSKEIRLEVNADKTKYVVMSED
jgi:hypothetical protein